MRIWLEVYHKPKPLFMQYLSLLKWLTTQHPVTAPLYMDKEVRPREIRYLVSGFKLIYERERIYTWIWLQIPQKFTRLTSALMISLTTLHSCTAFCLHYSVTDLNFNFSHAVSYLPTQIFLTLIDNVHMLTALWKLRSDFKISSIFSIRNNLGLFLECQSYLYEFFIFSMFCILIILLFFLLFQFLLQEFQLFVNLNFTLLIYWPLLHQFYLFFFFLCYLREILKFILHRLSDQTFCAIACPIFPKFYNIWVEYLFPNIRFWNI